MNVESIQQQAYLGELTQHVTPSTPIVRFVPTAASIPDQIIDQWVEKELQRGRSRMRTGLVMLACLAVAAIPLVILVN